MSKYTPDMWVLVKIVTDEEELYKVFGTWRGGYLSGDSWRMNSGIRSVTKRPSSFVFHGYTNSEYICYFEKYGTSMYSLAILDHYISKSSASITVLSEEEALEWAEKKAT